MRDSRFVLLASTTAIALFMGGPASGQNVAPAETSAESMDEVVVTGSRIQNRDYEATSPVVTIERRRVRALR